VKMSFFKDLFGGKPHRSSDDPLVAKLLSNSEQDFLAGLKEAVRKADAGKHEGIKAIREAIRIRSGKEKITFYKAKLGMVIVTNPAIANLLAREEILDLAKRHALLLDPKESQRLISSILYISDNDDLSNLVKEIFRKTKPRDGYEFQLLYHELRSTAKLKLSH
jgi:hypothetical protein